MFAKNDAKIAFKADTKKDGSAIFKVAGIPIAYKRLTQTASSFK